MTTTISVALCSFNGARYIREQIQSILDQSRLPDELVLSDDASSDGTVAVVEDAMSEFHASSPDRSITLRVIRNDAPLGVVRNFEHAISASTGDLIVLCDQDDRWDTGRIQRAFDELAKREELLLVFSNARLVDERGEPIGHSLFDALGITRKEKTQVHGGSALFALLGRNLVTGATTMFRRELLAYASPFPDSWVHDEWLAVVAAAVGRIDFIDADLIDYRQHGDNAIGARRLGLGGRLRKLAEPRESRNRRLLERSSVLVDRLLELGAIVSTENVVRARGKRDHEQFRSNLPAVRIRRLVPVLREAARGGYSNFGRGAPDVLRDLVQPAR